MTGSTVSGTTPDSFSDSWLRHDSRSMPSTTVIVNHPKLFRVDNESMRNLPALYDQHDNEVLAQANQLEKSIVDTDTARSADFKFVRTLNS